MPRQTRNAKVTIQWIRFDNLQYYRYNTSIVLYYCGNNENEFSHNNMQTIANSVRTCTISSRLWITSSSLRNSIDY